jgi:hypothetical protein
MEGKGEEKVDGNGTEADAGRFARSLRWTATFTRFWDRDSTTLLQKLNPWISVSSTKIGCRMKGQTVQRSMSAWRVTEAQDKKTLSLLFRLSSRSESCTRNCWTELFQEEPTAASSSGMFRGRLPLQVPGHDRAVANAAGVGDGSSWKTGLGAGIEISS